MATLLTRIFLKLRENLSMKTAKKKSPRKLRELRPKRKLPRFAPCFKNGCTLLFNHGIYLQKTEDDAEDDEGEEEEEEEKPKKKRAPPKKKAEPKEKPAPKKRASKKKKEVGVFLFCLRLLVTSFHLGV